MDHQQPNDRWHSQAANRQPSGPPLTEKQHDRQCQKRGHEDEPEMGYGEQSDRSDGEIESHYRHFPSVSFVLRARLYGQQNPADRLKNGKRVWQGVRSNRPVIDVFDRNGKDHEQQRQAEGRNDQPCNSVCFKFHGDLRNQWGSARLSKQSVVSLFRDKLFHDGQSVDLHRPRRFRVEDRIFGRIADDLYNLMRRQGVADRSVQRFQDDRIGPLGRGDLEIRVGFFSDSVQDEFLRLGLGNASEHRHAASAGLALNDDIPAGLLFHHLGDNAAHRIG